VRQKFTAPRLNSSRYLLQHRSSRLLTLELPIKVQEDQRKSTGLFSSDTTTLALETSMYPHYGQAHLRCSEHPPPAGRCAAEAVVRQPRQLRGAAASRWALQRRNTKQLMEIDWVRRFKSTAMFVAKSAANLLGVRAELACTWRKASPYDSS